MPRIRLNDQHLDLCASCWPPTKEDLPVLAELVNWRVYKLVEVLVQEGDGGAHSSYSLLEEICAICGSPLTEEDDVGEEVNPDDYLNE